jgi:hypothetical protein
VARPGCLGKLGTGSSFAQRALSQDDNETCAGESPARTRNFLLQAVAFPHEALEAGFVEEIVGQFFVGEHG